MIEASDSVDFFWMRRRPCGTKTVMRLDLARLPNDPVLLQRVVRELAAVLQRQDAELTETKARWPTAMPSWRSCSCFWRRCCG